MAKTRRQKASGTIAPAEDCGIPALTERVRRAFEPHWVLGPGDVTHLLRAVAARGQEHARVLGEELLELVGRGMPEEGRLSLYDPDDSDDRNRTASHTAERP